VLYGGALYDPPAALAHGLADGVSVADVLAEARGVAEGLAERPAAAFRTVKASLKAPALERARAALESLREAFVDAWFSTEARRRVGEARARLTRSR
jgi:hypothetical protein